MTEFAKMIGKSRGHFSSKENRAQKLIDDWKPLQRKMAGIIIRGHGETTFARCAYGVLLMTETAIRVGNESSAEGYVCQNKYLPQYGKIIRTYGLTSLENRHVSANGKCVTFNFLGKKGEAQDLVAHDPILIRYARELTRGQPKRELFLRVSSSSLKRFVKKYIGRPFTPKDIRNAKINLEFVTEIAQLRSAERTLTTKREMKRHFNTAIENVANRIGHTRGVCKRSYLSASLLESYSAYLEKQVSHNSK